MVVVMTFYNLFAHGLIGTVSLKGILIQFIMGFIIAFLLELFIVGPAAKKIACSLPYSACLFMDWEPHTFLTT
jgi:hypothetical protein